MCTVFPFDFAQRTQCLSLTAGTVISNQNILYMLPQLLSFLVTSFNVLPDFLSPDSMNQGVGVFCFHLNLSFCQVIFLAIDWILFKNRKVLYLAFSLSFSVCLQTVVGVFVQ